MPRSISVHPDHKKTVRVALERNGFITQATFSAHVGAAPSTVNLFFNCKPVSAVKFEEICEALNLNIRQITQPTQLDQRVFVPNIFNADTWVGRGLIVDELTVKLKGNVRLLWITGISGIGKTTLGECLASKAWEGAPLFQWIYLEILKGQNSDFATGAADLLAKMGEPELDPLERNNPNCLTERLIRKLQGNRYWIQLDSLERLFSSEKPNETEDVDENWVTFFRRCLTTQNFSSRLVLTAQSLPSALAGFKNSYCNVWQEIKLKGLSTNAQENEALELFQKNGVTVDGIAFSYLMKIAQIYEGHPLVLQVIARDILSKPFCGDLLKYWQRYGTEFEQVARALQSKQMNPVLYNQVLQNQVRHRVESSLKSLPQDAFDLLCCSSVYRRSVPETFWLAMIKDRSLKQQQKAYSILHEWALVKKEDNYQNQLMIRQHNLVRDVAYDLLKDNTAAWKQAESQAAQLWLTDYKPVSHAFNLETVRGYLEAFYHNYKVGNWKEASRIYISKVPPKNEELHTQLYNWSYYEELCQISEELYSKKASPKIKTLCLIRIGNSFANSGNQEKAIQCYEQAIEILPDNEVSLYKWSALNGLGSAHNYLMEYEEAEKNLKSAIKIASELSASRNKATSLAELGLLFKHLGDYKQLNIFYDLSVNCYKLSLKIMQEFGNENDIAFAIGGLGTAYYHRNECKKALRLHNQALIIFEKNGARQGEGYALSNKGVVYNAYGKYDKAIKAYQKHLKISQEIGDRRGQGIALCRLGETQSELGQDLQVEAKQNLNTALEIFCEIHDRAFEAKARKNLAKLS